METRDFENRLGECFDVAERAAREAGRILKSEFNRPGGPRRVGQDAPIDVSVELIIREHLLGATPTGAFVGEETGVVGVPGDGWCWYVDPNDGTRAYLQGHRGVACSIGLLDRGVPIAGVVFAPLVGRDGDFFAWQKGEALFRNGQPIRSSMPCAHLTSGDVVLVSYDADDAPEAVARACRPARFLKIPSIAYRLALFATGQYAAVVSNRTPAPWDIAGGHALMRGSGLYLCDKFGRDVRYGRGRDPVAQRVFGGSAQVITELGQRRWGNLDKEEPGPVGEMTQPAPGMAAVDDDALDRVVGGLAGFVIGDWLGTSCGLAPTSQSWMRGQPSIWSEALWVYRRAFIDGAEQPAPSRLWDVWSATKPRLRAADEIVVATERDIARAGQMAFDAIEAILEGKSLGKHDIPAHDDRTLSDAVRKAMQKEPRSAQQTVIAGLEWGLVHGLSAIEDDLLRTVLTCRPTNRTHYPRPSALWPVNLRELGERIVVSARLRA